MQSITPEIFPLFSSPVYYVKDTGFRLDDCLIDNLVNDKNIPGVFDSKHPCQLTQDVYILKRQDLAIAKQLCESHLHKYVTDVCGFKDEFYITNSWLTRNAPGLAHQVHDHPNSLISGCLYLRSSNESKFGLHGDTHFTRQIRLTYNHTGMYNLYNTANHFLEVDTGAIVIWPSDVKHSSNANPLDTVRVALCFNAFVRGKFGFNDNIYAAELELK